MSLDLLDILEIVAWESTFRPLLLLDRSCELVPWKNELLMASDPSIFLPRDKFVLVSFFLPCISLRASFEIIWLEDFIKWRAFELGLRVGSLEEKMGLEIPSMVLPTRSTFRCERILF